jgi:hypothetical protein
MRITRSVASEARSAEHIFFFISNGLRAIMFYLTLILRRIEVYA